MRVITEPSGKSLPPLPAVLCHSPFLGGQTIVLGIHPSRNSTELAHLHRPAVHAGVVEYYVIANKVAKNVGLSACFIEHCALTSNSQ